MRRGGEVRGEKSKEERREDTAECRVRVITVALDSDLHTYMCVCESMCVLLRLG